MRRHNNEKVTEIWIDKDLNALYFKHLMKDRYERIEIDQFVGIGQAPSDIRMANTYVPIYYPAVFKKDWRESMDEQRL